MEQGDNISALIAATALPADPATLRKAIAAVLDQRDALYQQAARYRQRAAGKRLAATRSCQPCSAPQQVRGSTRPSTSKKPLWRRSAFGTSSHRSPTNEASRPRVSGADPGAVRNKKNRYKKEQSWTT
ncbi:MAG: hypothetical protein JWR24_5655 [Actinoallomurus sp.]|nr:hypothetical protein [Actinoallomurus sp.]